MALSMLDIPFPEDDDMSDDEFDGYIDPDETSAEGFDDGNGEDSEPSDDVPPSQTSSSQRALRLT